MSQLIQLADGLWPLLQEPQGNGAHSGRKHPTVRRSNVFVPIAPRRPVEGSRRTRRKDAVCIGCGAADIVTRDRCERCRDAYNYQRRLTS